MGVRRDSYGREAESERERLDRQWNELLQELRVAQTGTQILFAFLLTIAFTRPFQEADVLTQRVFAVTLVLSALATGLLIAPVAVHRSFFRRHLRRELVDLSNRFAMGGVLLLMLAMTGGLLVALDVVLARALAVTVSGGVLLWLAVFWFVVPGFVRRGSPPVDE